ncbi:hypothetical protein GCM10027040_09250 [Halomonas shantousis]
MPALALVTGLFWLATSQAIAETLGLLALFTGCVALTLTPGEVSMRFHVPVDGNSALAEKGDDFVSGVYTLCAAIVGTLVMLFLLN